MNKSSIAKENIIFFEKKKNPSDSIIWVARWQYSSATSIGRCDHWHFSGISVGTRYQQFFVLSSSSLSVWNVVVSRRTH